MYQNLNFQIFGAHNSISMKSPKKHQFISDQNDKLIDPWIKREILKQLEEKIDSVYSKEQNYG